MPNRRATLILILFAACWLLAACVPAAAPAPVPTPTPAQALPQGAGGTLIMALGARDPESLDPALVADTGSAFVARQLFSGLVRLDANLEVAPDLAESWELGPDGVTYTFTLRPGTRFADGTPLTTEHVRYSLERATDPDLGPSPPAATYLADIVGVREKLAGTAESIAGVRVLDERRIAITIDAPKGFFLAKLAHPTSFVVDRRAVEAGGADWTEQPNSSGPFTIERWDHDQLLLLARNPSFHRDLARLDRVRMLMGAAASNALVLYEEGEIDLVSVPSYGLARVRDESGPFAAELLSVPQLSLSYIGMNVTRPPFDDPKVREAFALLIDRARLAEVSLNGAATPAAGVLPPGMPGHDPARAPAAPDPERARTLIAESRYGSPDELPPIVAYGGWAGLLRDVAEEELGISIEVRAYEEYGDFLAALDQSAFQIFSTGWVADYPDPENFLAVLFHGDSAKNNMAYNSPAVNALLDEAAVLADEAARHERYRAAEGQILADAPVIPLYHDVEHLLVKPYVRGLQLTPMGLLDLSTVELAR